MLYAMPKELPRIFKKAPKTPREPPRAFQEPPRGPKEAPRRSNSTV